MKFFVGSKEKGLLFSAPASLLMEEHQALQAIVSCPDGDAKAVARLEYLKKSSWLLEERDKSIAQRIRETLPEGRTGLLFIGVAHDVGSLLNNEIRVSTPEVISRALPEVLRDFYSLGGEKMSHPATHKIPPYITP